MGEKGNTGDEMGKRGVREVGNSAPSILTSRVLQCCKLHHVI